MAYAAGTDVPVERSKGEIERILQRYGAHEFINGWKQGMAVVGFKMKDRMVRFELPLPSRDDFKISPGGRQRTSEYAIDEAYEQECRRRWRALALAVKAKLEVVESGIADFESEFLGYIVLPGGQTMSEWARPQLELAYEGKKMPELLGWSGQKK